MIRNAIEQFMTARPERRSDGMLWVSDLGMHPAKAMKRILYHDRPEFDVNTLVKMQSGNVLEDDTGRAIQFGFTNVITQFPLFNDKWSGYADFVIGHGTDEVIIVEHKTQGDKWWDYKGSLPRASHICQLWMYGWLYEQAYGIRPWLILYYRAWGNWAEFELEWEWDAGQVTATGRVDDTPVERMKLIAPNLLRLELEDWYLFGEVPQGVPENEDDWDYAESAYARLAVQYGVKGTMAGRQVTRVTRAEDGGDYAESAYSRPDDEDGG